MSASLPGAGKIATVTGGTGYVGGELVRQLLLRGYAVRAVTRSSGNANARAAPLTRLAEKAGAANRLALHPVPSLQRRSPELDAAVRGATYVFHVASPFRFDGDPETDVVAPAVEGTRAVLGACGAAAAAGDKPQRVVVTSSVCAIHDMKATQPRHRAPGGPSSKEATDALSATAAGIQYDEQDWNDTSAMPAEAYWVSKVKAEREAWACAKEYDLSVATILPNFVLGPVALEGGKDSASGSVSVGFLKKFVEASAAAPPPPGFWTICDVRDVAEAHWRAAEIEAGAGERFIISQPQTIDARFVTDVLKKRFGAGAAAVLPDGAAAGDEGRLRVVDGTKATKVLGLKYTDPADTVADMAASLLEKGVAEATWFGGEGGKGAEEEDEGAAVPVSAATKAAE